MVGQSASAASAAKKANQAKKEKSTNPSPKSKKDKSPDKSRPSRNNSEKSKRLSPDKKSKSDGSISKGQRKNTSSPDLSQPRTEGKAVWGTEPHGEGMEPAENTEPSPHELQFNFMDLVRMVTRKPEQVERISGVYELEENPTSPDGASAVVNRRHPRRRVTLKIYLRHLYASNIVQYSIAGLIFFNFVVNAVEKQITTPDADTLTAFQVLELFFTVVFTIELVWNMYAHWCWPFWSSGWNLFDFVVVAISLMSLVLSNLPGISTLRLMRAFRVFRLFKRLESLRKIIKGLENAIPGCMNAFGILVLVTSIYAILGVEFFRDVHPYYFSRFSASFFTLFQVMTGDSWAEAIARPIIDEYPHAALFFITYFLMTTVMLVNVVVAILIEKIFDKGDGEEDDDEEYVSDFEDEEEVHNPLRAELLSNREVVLMHLGESIKEMITTIPEEGAKPMTTLTELKHRESFGILKSMTRKTTFNEFSDEAMKAREAEEERERKQAEDEAKILEAEAQAAQSKLSIFERLKFSNSKPKVNAFYNGTKIQVFIASLIALNFVVNAVESQVPDAGPDLVVVFGYFELFFTVVFTIELVVNLYAHWFCEFWSSGWNVFDFIVVMISLMSLVFSGLPGISTLRLMRAFRVFRLFKKLKSLRVILIALEKAIPGCSNAMAILVLIASIYSILGVQFFAEMHSQYFHKFSMAFFSMFQVLTGESWAAAVARPIIDQASTEMKLPCALFFISYFLICNIMLMNVVIAILLENMTKIQVEDRQDEQDEQDGLPPNRTMSTANVPMSEAELQLLRLKCEVDDLWEHSANSLTEMTNYIKYVRRSGILGRVKNKMNIDTAKILRERPDLAAESSDDDERPNDKHNTLGVPSLDCRSSAESLNLNSVKSSPDKSFCQELNAVHSRSTNLDSAEPTPNKDDSKLDSLESSPDKKASECNNTSSG